MTNLDGIGKILIILSGKGGVGKSTTAVQIALALSTRGKKIGLLDLDLCGPSLGLMLNLNEHEIYRNEKGWIPIKRNVSNPISVMSIAFLLKGMIRITLILMPLTISLLFYMIFLDTNTAIVWRGPKKTAMINQFLNDVDWGCLDYLIIDTPPGTSDEHISLIELLKPRIYQDGAVLITTPQTISVNDVRREITFCRKANVPILGIIENMSGYVCSNCKCSINLFSFGGGKSLAEYSNVPFLGTVPIDPNLAKSIETGNNFLETFQDSPTSKSIQLIIDNLIEQFNV